MQNKVLLGASLKMYFGYQQTLEWCEEIATLLRQHPLAQSERAGFFLFPSMPAIAGALARFEGTPMQIGAQDMSAFEPGAWTGETAAEMLSGMGCQVVELGHAERRRYFHETDELIIKKVVRALTCQLTPVICIGEDDKVDAQTATDIALSQVRVITDALPDLLRQRPLIFAWEPKWAIGAAQPASVDYIRAVCSNLKQALATFSPASKVIYGGSAGPGLLSKLWPAVDGLFLGRFAHKPPAYRDILDEAQSLLSS